MAHVTRRLIAVTAALTISLTGGAVASPAFADPRETVKDATATGYGGAVSTVNQRLPPRRSKSSAKAATRRTRLSPPPPPSV